MTSWWAMVGEWDITKLTWVLGVLEQHKLRTLGTERDDLVRAITRLEALRNSIVAWRDNDQAERAAVGE